MNEFGQKPSYGSFVTVTIRAKPVYHAGFSALLLSTTQRRPAVVKINLWTF